LKAENKELKADNKELKAENKELKDQIKGLNDRMTAMEQVINFPKENHREDPKLPTIRSQYILGSLLR
jgi:cell division protein FtsB